MEVTSRTNDVVTRSRKDEIQKAIKQKNKDTLAFPRELAHFPFLKASSSTRENEWI